MLADVAFRKTARRLRTLGRDDAGNALILTAAATLPILAMVGSAIDISRYYIMQSRLQNACDAAVLAGRKSMEGLEWRAANAQTARDFFNFNFPATLMGAVNPGINLNASTNGKVTGNASVTVPTLVMGIFGFGDKPLAANCSAEVQLPNTDIMFALDTTLSMNETNAGDSNSRIVTLRNAVRNFYDTIARSATTGATIRYGFVPFSSTVNVGFLLQRDWLVDRWTYQSRVADGTQQRSVNGTTNKTWRDVRQEPYTGTREEFTTYGSPENCVGPPNDLTSSDPVVETGQDSEGRRTRVIERRRHGSSYSAGLSGGRCRIIEVRYVNFNRRDHQVEETTTTGDSTATDYYWVYRPREFNVSALKGSRADGTMAGGSLTELVGNNHTNLTTTWTGCIEERDTVVATTYDPIPSNALDMDIDLIPTSGQSNTQWRPHLPQLVFVRRSTSDWQMNQQRVTNNWTRGDQIAGSLASVCPTRARKLAPMTANEVTGYVNSLQTGGWTYLDIGMLWAGRLLSPTGLFRAENGGSAGATSVSRHLIFMTDGQIETFIRNYDAYGLSALDRRRTNPSSLPTDSQQNSIVSDRFDALCTAVKAKGITIWTVAFGTSLTSQLQNCASGRDRAFSAQNSQQLNQAFEDIAAKIAQLRLTE